MNLKVDFLVLGGGAAGFFAAVNAARMHRGLRVAVVEKSSKVLSKVLVSGGGRCNVTHHCLETGILVGNYPRGGKELRQVFGRWGTQDTIHWFEQRGVILKTEADGRMFPVTDRSETVARCLLSEAEKYGVGVLLNMHYETVRPVEGGFVMEGPGGTAHCRRLLVATGGHPKGEAYRWLEDLGHLIVPPVPSLFTFNLPQNPITELMGVSTPEATVRLPAFKKSSTGPLLITHWGLSGPAILRLSALAARDLNACQYRFGFTVQWLPSFHEDQIREQLLRHQREHGQSTAIGNLGLSLPARLGRYLIQKAEVDPTKRWSEWNRKEINRFAALLASDPYQAQGKTTFKEEFVTAGGVHLGDVDLKDMQSKRVPNLYFAGEVLDIDGVTGGFNFQAAWSTGWIAAQGMGS
jgi:predicted Rossmann fold flavoprotein